MSRVVCLKLFSHAAAATAALLLAGMAQAATVSPVQSTARPLGLDIVGPVMLAASDERSSAFQTDVLPELIQTVGQNLSEKDAADIGGLALDPSRLFLSQTSSIRAYFVGEGSGYHNALGFFTTPYDRQQGLGTTDAKLIFPDASSSISYVDNSDGAVRSRSMPLLAGDFVEMGTISAGTQLSLFIVTRGNEVFTTDPTQNGDGMAHAVSFAMALRDSSYVLVGFEDFYGGGDQDYNDVVIALDIGRENVAALVRDAVVPLPSAFLASLGLAAWILLRRPSQWLLMGS